MSLPLLNLLIFAFTCWLGLYLIARDHTKPVLVYTGLGLVGYTLSLALYSLTRFDDVPKELLPLQAVILLMPALCWFAAALHLLPEKTLPNPILFGVRYAIPVVLMAIYYLFGDILYSFRPSAPIVYRLSSYIPLGIGVLILLLMTIGFVAYRLWHERRRRLWGLLLTLTLFFTLGAGIMLLPSGIVPFDTALLIVGIDLLLLDFCIAGLDAFDEGETLLPDATYSFIRAMLIAFIFGGQVALASGGQYTFSMLALLFGVVAAAIASQVFAESIQNGLDRLVFARLPRLRRARAELRTAASLLPRTADNVNLNALTEDEFIRLTRRALSHLTDPGKLAVSPLMHLPMLDKRVKNGHMLERAAELKLLLTDSIQRLKPPAKGEFGTADEWRFYNVLYFPYVLGVKLLSYNDSAELTDDARKVVEWFRANVPERTLHNWQTAAARLIAQDLRDQMR
ncbi:MAG: hypothetical protein GC179_11035 [Anaerolineaceae bacterium]|nr:hypothetical protein [Anaerolineaceae bacterium]